MPVAMNLGIAVGAAAGSAGVDRWSAAELPLLALLPAVLAVAGFVAVARPRVVGEQALPAPSRLR